MRVLLLSCTRNSRRMKASELRIGNRYINDCGDESLVFEILDDSYYKEKVIVGESTQNHSFISDCKPIPLNEDWLLDFGFQYFKYNCSDAYKLKVGEEHLEFVYCEKYLNGIELRTNGSLEETDLGIKYVHQLQNLYFALTGEELTIKEKVDGK